MTPLWCDAILKFQRYMRANFSHRGLFDRYCISAAHGRILIEQVMQFVGNLAAAQWNERGAGQTEQLRLIANE